MMTETEMRIAIAEKCGWVRCLQHGLNGVVGTVWNNKSDIRREDSLPNYPADLNAMHEAEKALQDQCKYWPDYIDELSKLFRCGFPNKDDTNWSQMCHATALQRAEAFCRVFWLEKFQEVK